jgi:hypothetical protein
MRLRASFLTAFVVCSTWVLGVGCSRHEDKADRGSELPDVSSSSPMVALTPTEYNHTIRDLLGMPDDGEDWPSPESVGSTAYAAWPWVFPEESGISGFDGIADGQVPSAVLLEQQQAAAAHFSAYALSAPSFLTCSGWSSLSRADKRACGWESVERFAQRAWRRPITEEERERLQIFWALNISDGTPEEAIQLTLTGILQSPAFLYRLEMGRTEDQRGDAIPLTDFEMASRLSYFLWDSMPDAELLALAGSGELRSRAQVQAAARRMLQDDKARMAVVRFHEQWLGTTDIHKASPARSAYGPTYFGITASPKLDTSDDFEWPYILLRVRKSMQLETQLFVERTLFDGAGTFSALMTDNHGYMSSDTQPLYGDDARVLSGPRESWTGVETSGFDLDNVFTLTLYPTEFPAKQRAGVLTQPAVLSLYAHPVHPSPVLRGKFIVERMACQPSGLPPPSAEGAAPPDVLDADSTNRMRTEVATSPPACAGCHETLNAPGFGLENFDSMGGWRSRDNGERVDASGQLRLSGGEQLEFDGPVDLAQQLAQSTQVRDCYVRHWASTATGVALGADEAGLAPLQAAFQSDDAVLELLVSIAGSDLFRYRRAGGAQ